MAKYCIEPKSYLLDDIVNRIHKHERFFALKRISFVSLALLFSCISLIPAWKSLLTDLSHSGFLSFASLLFSDFSTISHYWKSFIMALIETLPAFSISLFLLVVLLILQSVRFLACDLKTLREAT